MEIITLTIYIGVMSTVLCAVIGIALAYMFKGKIGQIIDALMTLPMVMSPTVIGFLLLRFFGTNSVLGKMFESIGIKFIFTVNGAILSAFVVSLPLLYKTVKAGFSQINNEVLMSARTLGLSEKNIFFKIVIPQSKISVLAGIILAFSRAIGEFGATIMVAGNIPSKTQTISLKIYTLIQSGKINEAYSWVLLTVGISLIFVTILGILTREKKYENKH